MGQTEQASVETDPMKFVHPHDRKHIKRFANSAHTGVDRLRLRSSPVSIGFIAVEFHRGHSLNELAEQHGVEPAEIEAALRTVARMKDGLRG